MKREKSRCYACQELVYDDELKEDIKGWERNEQQCRKCLALALDGIPVDDRDEEDE